MKARILILPKQDILHPPDGVVLQALRQLGFSSFEKLTLGRYIELDIGDIPDLEGEKQKIALLCEKCPEIYNPNIEELRVEIAFV